MSQHPTQKVVEIVSNTARQRSHALQLLPGEGLLLGALDFGDVFDHGESVERLAVGTKDNGCSQVDPDDLTGLLHIPLLDAVEGNLALEEPLGKLDIRSLRHPGA